MEIVKIMERVLDRKMMKEHQFRGHKIELVNNKWLFSVSDEPVQDNWKKIPCGICGEKLTKEGHDKCIGTLPGVMNACCGHGQIDEAYVMFSDEYILRGGKALDVIFKLKRTYSRKRKILNSFCRQTI